MPIYDMQCDKCNKVQEVITIGVNEPLPSECECGGTLKKVLAGEFGFKLKGECWASDGYKYTYTDSKAGSDQKVPCIHGRKTIDKKLNSMRMKDEGGE